MPGGSSRECRDRHLGRTRHRMDRGGRSASHPPHESRFRPLPAALSPARGVPPYRRNRPRSPDIRDVQVRLRSCRSHIQSRGPFSRATIRRQGHGPIPRSGSRSPMASRRSRMIFRNLHRPSQALGRSSAHRRMGIKREEVDRPATFAKTISVGPRIASGHVEGRPRHGPCGQNESVSRICEPGSSLPARRRHGRREILRSLPDRDEEGEGLPPLGPRRQRVRRLLPVLRSAHPGPRPPAGDEGNSRQPPVRPDHVLKNTLVLPFNDLDETAARIRGHADRLACVILEPVERSYIAPEPDFLNGLREITADHDIPLIFDEVMSGFRVAFGGAQHAYRVTPDLTCLGKIIGGGPPGGAFLGRPDILDLADPARGDFFQSTTFAGYPIAMAAGMATLDELEKPGAFDGLLETTRTLTSGFERHLKEHGVPAVVPGVGSVFSILFMNHAPRNYRDSLEADEAKRSVLDTSLLARGIFVKPGKPFYVSAAHDNIAIRETLDAFEESLSGPA